MVDRPVPRTPADAAPPRPAATVLLLRDAPAGPVEVLMLRRHRRSGFAARAWVFPGGVIDPADAALPPDRWQGIAPVALTGRYRLPAAQVLAMHVGGVRETFEEAGVLLALHADGRPVDQTSAALAAARRATNAGDTDAFTRLLVDHDLVADLAALTYWLRWVTPIAEPRRYDTCFFVARVPDGADPAHDEVETVSTRWVTAADALADDDFEVIYPTAVTLRQLVAFDHVEEVVHAATSQPHVRSVMPHVITDAGGNHTGILHPDDPDYPHDLYGPTR